MTRLAALVLSTLLFSTAHARADAIPWEPSCPPGSHVRADHAGRWCAPATCTTDADCEGHEGCVDWRVCSRTFEGHVPSRTRRDPPVMRTLVEVTSSCAPTESCTGTEEPLSTFGHGDITCAVARSCVPRPRPPLPPPLDAPVAAPAPSPPTSAAPSAAAPPEPSGLCRALPGRPTSLASVWLVCAVVVVRRRIAALAAALALGAGIVAAQADPVLPAGWHAEATGTFTVRALLCTTERAWTRDWTGSLGLVGREAGPTFAVEAAAYSEAAAIAPDGTIFLAGRDGFVRRSADGTLTTLPIPSGVPGSVAAIFAPSAREVFAVGQSGRLLRFTEGALVDHDSTTWRSLLSIDGVSAGDFWIGGADGLLLHRTASGIERIASPLRGDVATIRAFAGGDVWAATESGVSATDPDWGGAMHWDGAAWTAHSDGLPVGAQVEIFLRAGDATLAGGSFGVSRWDGTCWVEELPASTFMPAEGCARGAEAVFVDGWRHVAVREVR